MSDREIREEFKVESLRREYRDFIHRLRSLLAGNQWVRGCPVLPGGVHTNYPQFDVVLRTNQHEITLRFRRSDLYLEAYLRGNSNTWLEFSTPEQRKNNQHVVPNSEFLGFTGSYVGGNGLEITCGSKRNSIPLGREALHSAVNTLATSNNGGQRARSLLVILQMIPESLRFHDIELFILASWYYGAPPPARLIFFEENWGRISNDMLRYDCHPVDHSTFRITFRDGDTDYVITFLIATEIMALLRFNIKGIHGPHYSGRHRRSIENDEDGRGIADDEDGRAILEVFEVIIDNIDNETPGGLYGTITVSDGLLTQYIYRRDENHTESIYPKKKATLTGPNEAAISALDDFIIDVHLMDHDSVPYNDDEVISKGQIAWSAYDSINNVYDTPISQSVSGPKGSVTIVYAVLSNAVQAKVEVILVRGDDEVILDFHGTIFAGNRNIKSHESVLFHRDHSDIIQLRENENIPLFRSIVAVPLNSELFIRADLSDRGRFIHNSDDEIVKGTEYFPAKFSGESHGYIDGQKGKIEVKVTWIP